MYLFFLFFFFLFGLLILLLQLSAVAFLSDHIPFSLAMILAASGIVFIVTAMLTLNDACQKSKIHPSAKKH